MSVKISIIVPVYNGEKYLINCLSYLVNQTLNDIEIIIIDDASIDKSRYIMEECKRQYPEKVKCIYLNENHGAGGARNIGIKEANGDYIGFVDSDDQVETNMFEELYQTAVKGDYDIVDSYLYHEKEKQIVISTSIEAEGILEYNKRKILIQNTGYIVTKIYKTDLLRKEDILFRENVPFEDPDFLCRVYLLAKSLACVKKVFYFYRYNIQSTTKAIDSNKYINTQVEYMKALFLVFEDLDKEYIYRESLDFKLVYLYGKILESYILEELDIGLRGLMLLKEAALLYIGNMDNKLAKEKLDNNIYKILLLNNQDPLKVHRIREQLVK
jgi:glycosyltransferase involved in cell wall biosynthesis